MYHFVTIIPPLCVCSSTNNAKLNVLDWTQVATEIHQKKRRRSTQRRKQKQGDTSDTVKLVDFPIPTGHEQN